MSCCRHQLECTFGLSLSQSQTGGAFQSPCRATPMPQSGKDFQSFAERGAGNQVVSLLTVDVGHICQGARPTPWVSGFPEGSKCSLIQSPSGGHFVLRACHVALLVDRPGGASAITQLLKNVCRL